MFCHRLADPRECTLFIVILFSTLASHSDSNTDRSYINFLVFLYSAALYPLEKVPFVKNPSYPPNLPSVAWNPWTDIREREDVQALNVDFPYGPVPQNFSQLIRQSYFAATSYMDFQVGQLLKAVEDHGFVNDTIIVFIGDHGEITFCCISYICVIVLL